MNSRNIHVFVFCWPGKKKNAIEIAKQLDGFVEHLTVVDACPEPDELELPAFTTVNWLHVDPSNFYGGKFAIAIGQFHSDVLLQIQADATAPSWREVVERCTTAFDNIPHLGVWSADVSFTFLPTDLVRLGPAPGSTCIYVSQTDCIVWALRKDIVDKLRTLSYERAPLGWGIDLAALSFAYASGLVAVRDLSLSIAHPKGRGYNTDAAVKQMADLLLQLPSKESAIADLLIAHVNSRTLGVRGALLALLKTIRRKMSKMRSM